MKRSPYKELFEKLPEVRAPEGLHHSVVAQVNKIRLRTMRIRFVVFSSLGLASGAALFPLVASTATKMSESGFLDYASLALSDGGAVLSYWQEFSITLLESLPLLGVTFILVALLTMIQTFRLAAQNSDVVFKHRYI